MTTTTSGLESGQRLPLDLGRLRSRGPGHVDRAGKPDHLRDPVAADEGRVEPLEGERSRRRRPLDRDAHRRQPALQLAAQLSRPFLDPDRGPQPGQVLQHLAERAGVLLHHPRPARQPRRHLDHVLEGDGADVADRLGDDQVRRQLGQPRLVEAVERLPRPTTSFTAASISPALRPLGRTVAVR